MANYFNTLSLGQKLDQLSKCRFMGTSRNSTFQPNVLPYVVGNGFESPSQIGSIGSKVVVFCGVTRCYQSLIN